MSPASYSPHDGMVYAPALLRALHTAIQQLGCRILPNHKVTAIEANGQSYVVRAAEREFAAEKVVLAAGLGLAPLGELLGTPIPVTPERGQLIVTQSLPPGHSLPQRRHPPNTGGEFAARYIQRRCGLQRNR